MIKRNLGQFRWRIELLEPSAPVRDEMGGIKQKEYRVAICVNALKRDKSSTYKQVIGSYVNMDTAYFVIRDINRGGFDINTDWRLRLDGYTYVINSVNLLDDQPPYYIEIEATKIGGMA